MVEPQKHSKVVDAINCQLSTTNGIETNVQKLMNNNSTAEQIQSILWRKKLNSKNVFFADTIFNCSKTSFPLSLGNWAQSCRTWREGLEC